MARIKFLRKNQLRFFDDVRKYSSIDWVNLAKALGVSSRTLFDWKKGKYKISEDAFRKCLEFAEGKVEVPNYKVLPDFWNVKKAASMGGLVTAKKYGGPGTLEGRKKGGLNSQVNRKLHPELYKHCSIAKEIFRPNDSAELAELFGIILGDGTINNYQVVITLHKENDKEYVSFVCKLIKKLFKIKPVVYNYYSPKHKMIVGIAISSVSFISFLLSKGLCKGNKVKQQVGVPAWIRDNSDFARGCLRGLIDTDGGVYYHKHIVRNKYYFNLGLCFSNHSAPLLSFVKNQLELLKFHSKMSPGLVFLYSEEEVHRYAKEIQFHNPYHFRRMKNFFKIKPRKGV